PTPECHGTIPTDEATAVGAELHADDPVGMSQRLADGLAGVGVPQPHGTVHAAGREHVPVRAERYGPHLVLMAHHRLADGLAGVGVPQPYGEIVTYGSDFLTVATEGGTGTPLGVSDQVRTQLKSGRSVIQAQRSVVASCDEAATVR